MTEFKSYDILVEKSIKSASFKNPVKVTLNFDRTMPPIGRAFLKFKDGFVYADTNTKISLRGLFPCLGLSYENAGIMNVVIHELSFCSNRNQDETIEAVK